MSLFVNYTDAPEGAQESMNPSASVKNALADVSLIPKVTQDVPLATLEPGVWVLDGTMELIDDTTKVPWWSRERSDSSCGFTANPKLIIQFDYVFTATGLTLTFSQSTNQWCSEIIVYWYNGSTLLSGGTYYPNSPEYIINNPVANFNRIDIELVKTNHPSQFAKLNRVEIGRTILFGKDELVDVSVVNEIDPDLCELSADTMTFRVIDKKDRRLVPQENQKIEVTKDGEMYAVQFIKNSTREAKDRYKITCQSAIGLLNDTFLGGMYVDKPIRELLTEILGDWQFELDTEFDNVLLTGYLPVCKQREAIQQIAFAIGSVVNTHGTFKILFLPFPESLASHFTAADIFNGAKVETQQNYSRVDVYSHAYEPSEEDEILVQADSVGDNALFTFTEPHHSYICEGGEVTGSGVNWVTVKAAGAVTVTGKKYIHQRSRKSKKNPLVTAREQGNVLTVSDATLVHSGNVSTVLNRLYETSRMRTTAKFDAAIRSQRTGNRVDTITPWDTKVTGFIKSMESRLTQNGHTASVNVIGTEG